MGIDMAAKKNKKSAKKNKATAKRKRAPVSARPKTRPKRKVAPVRKSSVRAARPTRKVAAKKTKTQAVVRLAKPAAKPVRRFKRAGHLDPKYARDLLAQSGGPPEEERTFLDGMRTKDDLAEGLGEEFVEEVTSGENEGADLQDQEVTEERGGPFVVTTGETEFADGTDASNPKDAKREPFPRS